MPQNIPDSAIFVARLCHSGDCCPTLHVLSDEPHDSCILIADDFGNQARFGFETLFSTPLRPTEVSDGLHELHGPFDEQVYMMPDQHSALFRPEVLADIFDEAGRRELDVTAIEAASQTAAARVMAG